MKWWKQALLCLLILGVAAVVWYRFFPGAAEMAAEWGIGEAPAATAPAAGARRGGPRATGSPVVMAPVESATINDRLSAIGTGSALRTVALRPFASGQIVEIAVEPDSQVAAGEVIARLDSEGEVIAVDRAKLALDDARARLARIEALRSSNTATAVQKTDAELEVRNAELALREARLALERRAITAPIAGHVGILPVSVGDYVTSSDDIAVIADRSQILVDFWVPERYARAVVPGAPLTAESIARPDETYRGTVRAVDNQVDPESRTLRVQGRIDNPADTLRSGMAFRVRMAFPGERYPAVDPLAVQWGREGAYVWAVRDGVARRVPVTIIQRNADSVLVEGALAAGEQVVIEGVHAVREGVPVARGEEPARS
ncbi:efflux RND transporter periplasmic adaptor subunit [Chelativorans intermedius]|uniref:Efflux RND transporter periplasmic adaptor subunit n=1 Tax=Chelativorans intermedius TaxID=515947 RepID=A0ABV6D445_9HYPH|nr:efflux RND transporter periplasmic adaptor subunit [Chelativorans intermedius]MCT8997712.1 efflux RND transporter periplasmic adaptor subunit [Chelativorans intermedius]